MKPMKAQINAKISISIDRAVFSITTYTFNLQYRYSICASPHDHKWYI